MYNKLKLIKKAKKTGFLFCKTLIISAIQTTKAIYPLLLYIIILVIVITKYNNKDEGEEVLS